jgi:carbon starvation protein
VGQPLLAFLAILAMLLMLLVFIGTFRKWYQLFKIEAKFIDQNGESVKELVDR